MAASSRLAHASGVLRQPDFLKLWTGLTASLVGTQVSGVALPLVAILVLGASAGELGIIGAARWLPYLVFGLVAGVLLDRVPRRLVLVVSHLGRAVLLASITLAAMLGVLHVEQLVVVSFAVGALMIFSDAAYQALLPSLVDPAELVDGNAKLEASRSMAQIVGPGLGGWLVQLLGPPLAVAVDSATFLLDALLVSHMRVAEVRPSAPRGLRRIWPEMAEGLQWVFGHPLLRPIQLASMSFIGANGVWTTVYLLYLTRQLGLQPWQLGLLLSAGGPGTLVGSLCAGQVVARFGLGRPIVVTHGLAAAAILLIPLTALLPSTAAPLVLAGSAFTSGLMITVGSVCELSLRQGVTPSRLQGRMNATMRSLNWSTVAAGALVGGWLGDTLGLVPTLAIGGIGSLLSVGWLLRSPVAALTRASPPST